MAHFDPLEDFKWILNLTGKNTTTVWFKWYTWLSEQRSPQSYSEYMQEFSCTIDSSSDSDMYNVNNCTKTYSSDSLRGVCVFPLTRPHELLIEYKRCPFTVMPLNGTLANLDASAVGGSIIVKCVAPYVGSFNWKCGPGGKWEDNPNTR